MDSVTRCPTRRTQTVRTMIEDVIMDICDYYCKYPEQYTDYDDMLDEQCDKCPLGRL